MSKRAIDPDSLPTRTGSSYPAPFDTEVLGRKKKVLGEVAGSTHYGVNLVELSPGAWSAQRHWHTHEDEFVYVVKGELTLVTNDGEQLLRTGMAAGFPADEEDGHHLVNQGDEPAVYLEIGDRIADDNCHYPDIDLFLSGGAFSHKNGEPY